jgi:hypothetical protein
MRPRRADGAHSSIRRARAQRSTPSRPVTAQPYATCAAREPTTALRIDAALIPALPVDASPVDSVLM